MKLDNNTKRIFEFCEDARLFLGPKHKSRPLLLPFLAEKSGSNINLMYNNFVMTGSWSKLAHVGDAEIFEEVLSRMENRFTEDAEDLKGLYPKTQMLHIASWFQQWDAIIQYIELEIKAVERYVI